MALPLLTSYEKNINVDVNHDSESLRNIDFSLKEISEELKDRESILSKEKFSETFRSIDKITDVLNQNIGLFRKSQAYLDMQMSRAEGTQVVTTPEPEPVVQPAPSPPKNTFAVQNLSLGRIAGDTMREGRDRLLNKFRENSFVKFGSRLADGINAFRGKPTDFSQRGGEQNQSELEAEQKGDRNQKKIINLLEYLPKILLKLDGDKEEKKEEKGFLSKLLDFFVMFKAGEWLAGLLGGAGIAGLMAKGAGLLGAGLGIGAAIAKLGLAAVVAAAVIGTVVDSFVTFFNSDDWEAGTLSKIFGSIIGGSGGVLSSVMRGVAGAWLGFKAGAALIPVLGPFGPFIGMVLGGVIGAVTGYFGGKDIAEGLSSLGDWFSSQWDKLLKFLSGKTIEEIKDKAQRVIDATDDPDVKLDLTNKLDAVETSENNLQKAKDKQAEILERNNPIIEKLRPIVARGGTKEEREKYFDLLEQNKAAERAVKDAEYKNEQANKTLKRDTIVEDNVLKTDQIIYADTNSRVEIESFDGKNKIAYKATDLNRLQASNMKSRIKLEQEQERLRDLLQQDEEFLLPEDARNELRVAQDKVSENNWTLDGILGNITGGYYDNEDIQQAKETVERLEEEIKQKKDQILQSMGVNEIRLNDVRSNAKIIGEAQTQQKLTGVAQPLPDLIRTPVTTFKGDEVNQSELLPRSFQPRVEDTSNVTGQQRPDQSSNTLFEPDAVVANLSDQQIKQYALELIRREEMGPDEPALTPIQDPAKYWKDDGSKMMQLGYGSNFIKEGNEWVKVKPGYEGADGEMVYPHKLNSKAEADQLLRESFNREFDTFMADPEKKEIFDKIQNPARKMVLMSTIYQLGEHGMDKFVKTWPLIQDAVEEQDWNSKGLKWKIAASEMAKSIWHNEQTPKRAKRVIDVIANGGDVRWDDGVIYSPSPVPMSSVQENPPEPRAAEGRIVTGLEKIVVGDYKGIENNPEVVIPMNDLENRVLQTATKMMEIRDQTENRNNELLSMNNELRMQKFIESTQKIEQRIQAKEGIENSRNQIVIPPVVSQVDNSQLNQTNQSIIINRPVDNVHNPFRLSLG